MGHRGEDLGPRAPNCISDPTRTASRMHLDRRREGEANGLSLLLIPLGRPTAAHSVSQDDCASDRV